MSKIKKKDYVSRLEPLQVELNQVSHWLKHTGQRMLVIFEGRDTAGKGGAINAIAETLNPRQTHIAALPKPTERERGQWYFQRYVEHLPAAGELVLFDRSWYNRAGVEKVMGYCTDAEYHAFLKQVPVFEKLLTDDGIILLKYWLTVDQAQQEERFAERAADPLKRWKLSPTDLESRIHYEAYGKARDVMLEATHTSNAPWTLVDFNDQRIGRLTLIRHLLDVIPDHPLPDRPVTLDPLTSKPKKERFKGALKPIPAIDS